MYYTVIILMRRLKYFFCERKLNLEFILFKTLTAMLPPDMLQSKIHPKYFISLCCLILISPLFISNLTSHFNLLFVPKRMNGLGFDLAKMNTSFIFYQPIAQRNKAHVLFLFLYISNTSRQHINKGHNLQPVTYH